MYPFSNENDLKHKIALKIKFQKTLLKVSLKNAKKYKIKVTFFNSLMYENINIMFEKQYFQIFRKIFAIGYLVRLCKI